MKKILVVILFVPFAVRAQEQPDNALLWRVSGNGIPEGSYIFLAGPGCEAGLKLTPLVRDALKQAKAIAMDYNLYDSKDAASWQAYSMASADSQSVRLNLGSGEFQHFANSMKSTGAPDQVVQQFYSYRVSMVYYMLAMLNNPCGTMAGPSSYETLLRPYAHKNGLDYLVFQNVDNYLSEDNSHSTAYWLRNIRYALGNEDAFRLSLQTELSYYEKQDLARMKQLYGSDQLYRLRYSDGVVRKHVAWLAGKIDAQLKKQPTFIVIQVYNIVNNQVSVFDLLRKMDYRLTPMAD